MLPAKLDVVPGKIKLFGNPLKVIPPIKLLEKTALRERLQLKPKPAGS